MSNEEELKYSLLRSFSPIVMARLRPCEDSFRVHMRSVVAECLHLPNVVLRKGLVNLIRGGCLSHFKIGVDCRLNRCLLDLSHHSYMNIIYALSFHNIT